MRYWKSLILQTEHLPIELLKNTDKNEDKSVNLPSGKVWIDVPSEGLSMELVERELVTKALEKTDNNQTRAAKLLFITRDSLRYKMKKFGIL